MCVRCVSEGTKIKEIADFNANESRPSHVYTYSFEPKPDWSSFYASSKEIRGYFEDFAGKYDLRKYIKLNSRVERAVWDEGQGLCKYILSSEISAVPLTHE